METNSKYPSQRGFRILEPAGCPLIVLVAASFFFFIFFFVIIYVNLRNNPLIFYGLL